MKINYPNPTITNQKNNKVKTYGMLFESALNESNQYYAIHNKALIYKKPTPIQVVKVNYPSRDKARIIEAYYRTPSTTDYNGIYRAKYIDYEAKETINKSFSFKHIFPHQLEHLKKVNEQGGIAFVIIYYKTVHEIYIIDIVNFLQEMKNVETESGKKSITPERAKEIGQIVKTGYAPIIDYLQAVDELYFNK